MGKQGDGAELQGAVTSALWGGTGHVSLGEEFRFYAKWYGEIKSMILILGGLQISENLAIGYRIKF